ncbi:hypothetical protein [Gordonia insulae]|uniref:Uncharacterized protein n=1 Tax=Gordonia insulae TaxID=2420509 RepID=A0A3G8JV12_9ACTN|nr:hypothetical protein [Gordonia insulae]AZG47990.1 hypothetical protein D7316_04602 [Gordonia insulae]
MTAPIHPAPAEPGTRPARPDAVTIATELWVVVILGQIVAFIGQYPSLRDAWERQVRTLPADTPQQQVDMLNSGGTLIVVLSIFAVALTAISAGLVLLTRNGYNWARIVVAAMGVFIAVNLVFTLFGDVEPRWAMIPMVISGVAAIGASVLLLRRESEKYCREMAEHRRRPPQYPTGPPPGSPPWHNGQGHNGQGQPGPGYHQSAGQPWTYGDGQNQHPGYPPHGPASPNRPNEGNESRGES